jgi:hypothetical protein
VKNLVEFVADSRTTAVRIARLQAYFEEQVMTTKRFICSAEQKCRESHRGTFYAGQLPHVGMHYDLTRNGAPFRIVVVGQEYGHRPELVGLDERRKMIVHESGESRRFYATQDSPARNPHMKGCTSLLRLLFGKDLGSDYYGELVELDGVATHLFDCFALVNFLLCSAVPTESSHDDVVPRGGKPGRSTRAMQHNCARHFMAELEILEPTIIVLQGRAVLGWMKAVYDTVSDDEVQTVQMTGYTSRVLAFTHPSAYGAANWGRNDRTTYLLKVVAPAIRGLLEQA